MQLHEGTSGGNSDDDLLHRTPRMLSFPTQTDPALSDPASNSGSASEAKATSIASNDAKSDAAEERVKNQ